MPETGDGHAPDDGPLAFSFDAEHHGDPEELLSLLGGKGAGLAVMTAMGLPVPPGFTLTTAACRSFFDRGWTQDLDLATRGGLAEIESTTGKRLGDPSAPLLLSVRSGAEVSMPGMMDTVLDVGMSDDVAAGLASVTGDAAFATDTLRRSILSYATVVLEVPRELVRAAATHGDVQRIRRVLEEEGFLAPADPVEQVVAAVQAVFRSWQSPRAVEYRRVQGIDPALGTAVTVQAMVFGNLGESSGTGVAFTRDPSSGRPGLMGDFLVHAQGDEVVDGGHTTAPLVDMRARWPQLWEELAGIGDLLEREFADMVDIEFTIERGRLWLLQARRGKRTSAAAFRIAVDMAEDPDFPLDRAGAVRRCRRLLDRLEDDDRDRGAPAPAAAPGAVIATGLAASPGQAAGVLCVDVDQAAVLADSGVDVVLVRRETSPADVHGMAAAVGLVTTRGGLVSHAAVVARSWGLPAVVGATGLAITDDGVEGNGVRAAVGDVVTVDGDTGRLVLGEHAAPPADPPEAAVVRAWAAALDDQGDPAP